MNLLYGEVLRLFEDSGIRMGKVRIHGAVANVTLDLLKDVGPGDVVLVCDGVALSKQESITEENYVPGNPRQTH